MADPAVLAALADAEAAGMTPFEQAALAELRRIATAIERLAPPEASDPVVSALRVHFGRETFTSGEAIAAAQAQAEAAEAAGLRLPDLPHALRQAGLEGPHALGRYLASNGVARIGQDRAGTLWQVAAVSRGDETAKDIPQLRRRA